MRLRRTPAALVLGTLLLAPLAGCGGDKPHAGPAASASRTTSTPRALGPGEVAPDAFATNLLTAMKTKPTARITLALGSSLEVSGLVSYGASSTDARISADFGGRKAQIVLVAGAAYLQQGVGAKYVKVDKGDPVMGSLISQLSFAGPREALGAIRSGITKVVRTGPVAAHGQTLTRYRVSVDPTVAAQAFAAGAGSTSGPVDLDFDVDASGLLSQVSGEIAGQHLVLRIDRWGKPVTIKAPSSDDLLNNAKS